MPSFNNFVDFSKPESREGQLRLLILLVVLGSRVKVGGEGLVDPCIELHQTLLKLGRQWRQKHFGVCERVLASLVSDKKLLCVWIPSYKYLVGGNVKLHPAKEEVEEDEEVPHGVLADHAQLSLLAHGVEHAPLHQVAEGDVVRLVVVEVGRKACKANRVTLGVDQALPGQVIRAVHEVELQPWPDI